MNLKTSRSSPMNIWQDIGLGEFKPAPMSAEAAVAMSVRDGTMVQRPFAVSVSGALDGLSMWCVVDLRDTGQLTFPPGGRGMQASERCYWCIDEVARRNNEYWAKEQGCEDTEEPDHAPSRGQ